MSEVNIFFGPSTNFIGYKIAYSEKSVTRFLLNQSKSDSVKLVLGDDFYTRHTR